MKNLLTLLYVIVLIIFGIMFQIFYCISHNLNFYGEKMDNEDWCWQSLYILTLIIIGLFLRLFFLKK